jgi:hypothetical protein
VRKSFSLGEIFPLSRKAVIKLPATLHAKFPYQNPRHLPLIPALRYSMNQISLLERAKILRPPPQLFRSAEGHAKSDLPKDIRGNEIRRIQFG